MRIESYKNERYLNENRDSCDSTQSCSVSKDTIDLTVTRGTLWSNNLFKSANSVILTVRSNVSLPTEQLFLRHAFCGKKISELYKDQ